MRTTDVNFTRRVNLGNYEHCELSMGAALSEGEDAVKAAKKLRATVEHTLGLSVDFSEVESITDGGDIVMKSGEEVKATPETTMNHDSGETKEEPKEEKKPAKKKAAKKKASKKTSKSAPKEEAKEEPKKEEPKGPKPSVKYDPNEKAHRQELSGVLHSVCPGWNKDNDLKAKAKSVSREEMTGQYIFDDAGEILQEFRDTVKAKMNDAKGEDEEL